jgi:hypothetical protein
MIQLMQLLTEITLGSVTPYATQFAWKTERYLGKTYYESSFNAEGQAVDMTMSPIDNVHDETEYIFVFMTQDKWGLTSYSHQSSVAKGQLDYLRLIRTVGEAIIDFCTQYAPESVDLSGGDADPAMAKKKNRIYAAFLQHNAARLMLAGYTTLQRGDKLWIVRKATADPTGVVDDMPY